MILYHGSNVEIDAVSLEKCRPYKDFGRGFYLTELEDQAQKMAARTARIYGGKPYVTAFEFDAAALISPDFVTLTFDLPSTQWAVFVVNNRSREFTNFDSFACNHDCKYDIVAGPIANDDLALLLRQFTSGLIDTEALTREMKYKQLSSQYSFHTARAVALLRKTGACDG